MTEAESRTSEAGRAEGPPEPGDTIFSVVAEAVLADRQRAILAGMTDLSKAIHAASVSLNESGRPTASQTTDAVATWLDENADTLLHLGPREVLAEVEGFAQRHPAAFAAGAAALGAFLVSQFDRPRTNGRADTAGTTEGS